MSFAAPPAPLAADDELSALRLIRSRRVGPATFHRLLAEHGSAEAALDALPRIAAEAGIEGYAVCSRDAARAELDAGRRAGARLAVIGAAAYPAALAGIDDAPPVLWVRGRTACLSRPVVAIVGARNASSLGLRMATGLARALAEAGVAVIAGLARGIDTAAHATSAPHAGAAVMAGGIDVIYPAENAALAESLIDGGGCLLTEQPPGLHPVARHFPARNRIVSGLSAAVVVIEAAHRSGSLITARLALDQGREVMAVPGHPMDARAAGCNALIRDGAALVRNADDVLALLGERGIGAALRPDGVLLGDEARRAGEAGDGRIGGREERARTGQGGGSGRRSDSSADKPNGSGGANRSRSAHGSGAGDRPGPSSAVGRAATAAELQRLVIGLLGPSPVEEDALIRDLGASASAVAPVLLELELAGQIARLPGGRVALV